MIPRRITFALLPLFILLAAVPAPAAVMTVKKVTEKLQPAPDGTYRFGECTARLADGRLVIANGLIERTWKYEDFGLEPLTLRDLKNKVTWIDNKDRKGLKNQPDVEAVLTALAGQARPTEEPSLLATLRLKRGGCLVVYQFQVFPSASGILVGCGARAAQGAPGGSLWQAFPTLDFHESFTPVPKDWTLTAVTFFDGTDRQPGPLVKEALVTAPKDGLAPATYHSNLFYLEDAKKDCGLIFLKHAPLPEARPVKQDFDLNWTRDNILIFGGQELHPAGGQSYRWVTLAYSGGRAGRIAALQQYHRQLRQYDPTRDGLLLTNTWGDRSKDGRVSDAFMRTEIEAAARLGVDVVEIDDGWQKGTTANSVNKGGVWDNLYEKDPGFWQAHPERFPNGIKPLADLAKTKGIQFGLWVHPDSSGDFKNWEKDRELVMEMHHSRGVNYFKFDGIKITSRVCEANLHRLIDEIILYTEGRVTIDLDVTAEVRPGYFGIPNHGPLFVENRYTDNKNPEKAANSYWPWRTLRNLWLLAQYVDPVRLRMEFLNNARNVPNYGASPLAPAQYDPDYLFASVMMSSPLGWFETQHLPPAYQEKVAPLVKVWKTHREAIFNGSLIPVGEMPSGKGWTGFVSVAKDRKHAYALIFREVNEQAAWSVALPLLASGEYDVKPLAGAAGQVNVKGGTLSVELPKPRAYALLEITRR